MSNRFIPLDPNTSMPQTIAILNNNFAQLDNEVVVKTFNGPNGKPSIVEGKLPFANGYGAVYYDTSNVARILIGTAPSDGRMGIWMTKPGQDVIQKLS